MIQAYNIGASITRNQTLPSRSPINYNGVTLHPSDCRVNATLNGSWRLQIEHPIDDAGLWRYVEVGTVLLVPSFNGDQLFRIKQRTKSDKGVSADADPIFFDSANNVFLQNIHVVGKNAQQALTQILSGTVYRSFSNIMELHSAYYIRKNAMEAINGADNAVMKLWGGEVLYDNYTVRVMQRVGANRGLVISRGINLQTGALRDKSDITNVVTRIYPTGYKGRLPVSYDYSDSIVIDSYPIIYAKTIAYSEIAFASDLDPGQDTEGMTVCQTQQDFDDALWGACQVTFASSSYIDSTLDCRISALDALAEQAGAPVPVISLGDTITLRDTRLDIERQTRVTELEWNCIENRAESARLTSQDELLPDFPS